MSAWVGQTLVATGLLMVAVLLLRAPVRRLFGAGAVYALWLIPALRLVVPTIDLRPDAVASAAPVDVVFAGVAAAAEASGGTTWLMWLWAVGALMFAGGHVVAYRRFLSRALAGATAIGDRVVVSDAVDGPAAVGLLVPRILVPRDFATRFDGAERELALRHERIHLTRGDLWANAAALGMLSLHWFNPLAYQAYRAFREDQELSCDAAIIGAACRQTRAAYAAAMVKSAWGAAPPFTCPMSRIGSIKRRLKMVGTHKKSALASIGGTMTVGMLVLGGLTLTATGAAAADPVVKMERIVIKKGDNADAEAQLGKILGSKCGTVVREEIAGLASVRGTSSRIIMCNKDGAPTDRLAALQKARDGVASSSNLSDADRAKALGSIDEALAKARSR